VLWKNPDMTEGLSDLPWHRDCGMGGHASMCPVIIATVCLTTGGPDAGELRVLPGSHDSSFHFIDGNDPAAPTGIGLRVEAGDVSFHSSDLAHVSLPPTSRTGPFRISALVGFVLPDAHHHRGEGQYNDVLLDRDDGQVEHLVDKMRPGARDRA
jgi:ectoine hydroxylase-related dioxygenase (phytanoyl-CoA dioxygenase family)